VAFKADELTTKIFPRSDAGLWAGGCLQDTITKGGRPPGCPQNTHVPCPENTRIPCGGDTRECTQDTVTGPPPKRSAAEMDRSALPLLRDQLRERLARGPAATL
jgi:hypothetical protein